MTADTPVVLSTFDVFDTLLTRLVCLPRSLFLLVGEKAWTQQLWDLRPHEFAELRIAAEADSRLLSDAQESNLEEIYLTLRRMSGRDEAALRRIMALEIAEEEAHLIALPWAAALIKREREAGRTIGFISDMYLPGAVIRGWLVRHGLCQTEDRLWVSCEQRATKRTGALFRKVAAETGASFTEWRHFGNDQAADIAAPQRLGIAATYIGHANPETYETLLAGHAGNTRAVSDLLAGAGRRLRIVHCDDPSRADLAKVVGQVLGPVMTAYVLWILGFARSSGITKLYFVSRDGYVPWLLAKPLCAHLAEPLPCRYFYGSRQAWHLAGLTTIDQATLEALFSHASEVTCGSLAKRMDLTWEEIVGLAPDLTKALHPDGRVDDNLVARFVSEVLSNKPLQAAIMANALLRREVMIDYLHQEGILDGSRVGIVEMGWMGRTRASLERVIGSAAAQQLHWFYVGIMSPALPDPERVHCFLFGPGLPSRDIDSLPVVIESFCLAPHGSVTGYERENGAIVARFRPGIEPAYDAWGRNQVLSLIQDYASLVADVGLGHAVHVNMRSAILALLDAFCLRPEPALARTWGTMPFEHDQASEGWVPVAPQPRLTLVAMRHAFLFGSVGRAAKNGKIGTWGGGAWAIRERRLWLLTLLAWAGRQRMGSSGWSRPARKLMAKLKRKG